MAPDVSLLLDPLRDISRRYGVTSYPVAVVVDAEGKIRGYDHPTDVNYLATIVVKVLRGDAAAAGFAPVANRATGAA
jgi:hypothetical protein